MIQIWKDTRQPLPPGFLKDHYEYEGICPPPIEKEYDDHRRFPKLLPNNIPRVLEELSNSFIDKDPSHCMAIPLFNFYDAKTIKAEHLKDMDRQLLLSILATNEYEVGLTTVLIDADGDIWGDNDSNDQYKVHTTGTDPIQTAYTGCMQLPTGEMQVFTKPIDKSHPMKLKPMKLKIRRLFVTRRKHGLPFLSMN